MAAPQFVKLLTGVWDDGVISGYVLPLISTHLKYLAPEESQMTKLASQLDFAAEIEKEEASVCIEKIKGRLATADKEVVIPYGGPQHAMLLKLKFTESGLNVEIYNSGLGLGHHDKHPQPGVNKYNTCKEKLYPNMGPNSPEFNTLLTNILKYDTFKTIDESYAVFVGAQDVVSVAPNWQRDQKAGNCSLECVMAFLKKNMSPADYLQYRMTLISDVKTQAEAHKDSYEEKLIPKVEKRLDEMLANRKVKQARYSSMALLGDQQATPLAKQSAAEALCHLSFDDANRQPLVAAGFHIQLGALLGDKKATPAAKEYAAGALLNLSIYGAYRQPLVAACVHIPLMALLVDPQATPAAKEYAAGALCNLSEDAAHSQTLFSDGVHIPLSVLLVDQQATPDAKEYAAGALLNLSIYGANRQPLVAAGVHNSLRAFLSDPAVTARGREFSERALANLNERSGGTVS